MTQSLSLTQKYKLSVVSGGKPILPEPLYTSTCHRNVSCLTEDRQNYIALFNNQLKIYSVETRQCIKTIKFANNELLKVLLGSSENNIKVNITNILLGDITSSSEDNQDGAQSKNNYITIFTNLGQVVVLNYKGKLTSTPKYLQLNLNAETSEQVVKVFSKDGELRVLTLSHAGKISAEYVLYQLEFSSNLESSSIQAGLQLKQLQVFKDVVLSSWSSNGEYLVLLHKDTKERLLSVNNVFNIGGVGTKQFTLASVYKKLHSKKSSSNAGFSSSSRFITSMALDNSGTKLALGFASGVINLVNLADMSSRLLKWHIDSVLSLGFNQDGTYLMSGGWEKVLVFWQLTTDLQQFLPRLTGVICDIQTLGSGRYYSLTVQLTENHSDADYQFLLLNAADLKSKLSVSGPAPVFASPLAGATEPISILRSSRAIQHAKKLRKRTFNRQKLQDLTTQIEVNPATKHLYIPNHSSVQTFDLYKNEQVQFQFFTDGINNTMGKVRGELNIRDPDIKLLKVTRDGNWMITYEVDYPPPDDTLPSADDITHILKFWKRGTGSNQWNLKTKVLEPHGVGVPITNISVAPGTNAIGCLTADNNGGIKYWIYDSRERNWCLKKLLIPNFNHVSEAVTLAWSHDRSLVFHGFEDKLQIIDFETFRRVRSDVIGFEGELTFDSDIQALRFVGDKYLIVATRTCLCAVDLLIGKMVEAFDLYDFVSGVYGTGSFDNLICCDDRAGKVAVVVHQRSDSTNTDFTSHILIFNADLSKRLEHFVYDEYISWIGWNQDTDFIFLDIQSRLGIVGTTISADLMADEINREGTLDGLRETATNVESLNEDNYLARLRELAKEKASLSVDLVSGKNNDNDDIDVEAINSSHRDGKMLNTSSFANIFDSVQNIKIEALFDSVLRATS